MQSSPKVMCAALALTMVFLPFASNAFVGSKEELAEATSAWGRALGEDDPDKVCRSISRTLFLGGRYRRRCALTARRCGIIS